MTFEWIEIKKGLSKKVIDKGNEGKRPRFWSLINGKVIKFQQRSDEENPIPETTEELSMLRIGVAHDEWFRIIELCFQLMDECEVSQFRAITREAACITFELHLISIVSQASPIPCWVVSEVIEVSKQLKGQGVALHREKKIIDSFYVFAQALKLLIPLEVRLIKQLADNRERKDEAEVLKKEITSSVASMYNNLAACQLVEANYGHVVFLCDQVLERVPSDSKAIYRKASALLGILSYYYLIRIFS
jgi:hypothetical protein